jgi:hypothetical protein
VGQGVEQAHSPENQQEHLKEGQSDIQQPEPPAGGSRSCAW